MSRGGRIYLAGDVDDRLCLFALDLQGRPLWQATNGAAWRGSYPGARASAVVRDGRLFHLNAHGQVGAFEAATGRPLWSVHVLERFAGANITWALSEGLLVDGDRVVVTPGGAKALMAALDAKSGETRWASEPLRTAGDPSATADSAGYSSPILFRLGGRRHLVGCSGRHLFGVDADTGRLQWIQPMPTRFQVLAATPVLWRDAVFATGPDGSGGGLYRLRVEGETVGSTRVWSTLMDTCQHGVLAVGDALYGPFYRDRRRWVCADLATGEIRYDSRELTMGSSIFADGRIYALTQDGEAALLEPAASGFAIRGRFRFAPEKVSDAWTHPVVEGGRLYLRYHERLVCYDVRASAARR